MVIAPHIANTTIATNITITADGTIAIVPYEDNLIMQSAYETV